MASTSTGIISGSMSQATDPNAATTSTTSDTNPATATSATSASTPAAGNNVSSTPDTGSAVNYKSQLDAATPAASTAPAASTTTPSPTSASDWYTSDLGRAPDASGLAYWNARLAAPGADASAIKSEFLDDASANNESLSSGASSALAGQDQTAALTQENAQLQANAANAAKTATPTAAGYTANTLSTPTQLNVGANQTVLGQIGNALDPNSPIIQQARTAGLQQANQNGLLNSTMAVTAANQAAYTAALPIAEQDAATNNTDAATNAAAANNFALANQAAINTAGQFNASGQNTLTGQQIAANTSTSNANTAANTSIATNAASNATTVQVAQLNATNTANIQGASNVNQAASAYQSALNNIAQLNMDSESKYQAQLTAFNAYKNAVSVLDQQLGVPDLSGQLQFNQIDPATGSAPASAG